MKQGSSGLTLREHQAYHKPAFELTPKKVANWVQNLPMANVGESSMSSYRLLVDVNQSLLDDDKRLSILTSLEPVADELIHSLEKQYINNHIALTDKQKKVAALVQAIQTELAIGFHSIIESIIAQEIKRSNKKLLLTALVHAIHYHGLVILRCYQLYASVPRRIWRELYCLYQIAIQNDLENQKVAIEYNKQSSSASECILQILLLTVANPYQLHQREVELLWGLLPELSEHVSLKSHAYNKQHYVVDLNSSSPPIHKSLYKPQGEKNNLKLTVFTAIDQLKHMLHSVDDKEQLSARKTMLIRHLIQTWSHGTHRAFARTPCDDSINISIGLGATHYLLMQKYNIGKGPSIDGTNDTLTAMEGSLKDATLLDVAQSNDKNIQQNFNYLSSSGPPDSDVWEKYYQSEAEKGKTQFQPTNRSRDTIVRENYKFQEVSLLNMSPSGYCIQIAASELPKHAQTGEVLGFLELDQHNREHWSVGVVRWVRRQSKGSLVQMGVQLLAPGVTAINIKRRSTRQDENDFRRGLILPALTGIGQPATILTNPLYFSISNKIKVVEQGVAYNARLTKEVAATSSYRQFAFEKQGDATNLNAPPQTKNSPDDTEDIDGIWDIF
ncbi:hypothetical protein [Aliikangiella sp. IMCC44359]|uniref:hypothetical protein n=1 Tax=Aliikangiella sp. IMCC44359 TaxID=3459125 RepID=UPI00403B1D23